MKKRPDNGRNHGAATVFLTLILVPCLIFTCAFGDVSRVQLSKSQAAAAADLSLYSLMSNYDEDLKEFYGLVASCQSIDEFYDDAQAYFTGMMSANGIDGTASALFTSYISSLKTGDSFADFLQIEEVSETTVAAAENSALGSNPALIEDGIVEFMKYRGPVQIVSNLIDRFSSLNILDDLDDANEDEPIVEAKQEYAKAEGDMLGDMLYTYLALLQYNDYYNQHSELKWDEFSNYAEHLSVIRSDLKGVTELITEYYSFTSGITNLTTNFPTRDLPVKQANAKSISYGGTTYSMDNIGAEEEEEDNYSMSAQALSSILDGLDTYISNIENAANSIVSSCNGISYPSGTDANVAVYCMKMQNSMSTSNLSTIGTNGTKLMQMYAKILLAETCSLPTQESPVDPNWYQELQNAKSSIESIQRNYLSYGDSSTDYETVLHDYAAIAPNTVSMVQERSYPFDSTYFSARVTIGDFFEKVRGEFDGLSNVIGTQIANVDLIINGGTIKYQDEDYTVVSLDALKDSVKSYIEAREAWGEEAGNHSTDYAQSEQAEYNGTAEETADNELEILLRDNGGEMIEELRTRMTNIRNDLQRLKDALDGFTYGGSAVSGLSGETAITAGKTVVPSDISSVSSSLSQNESDAAEYYNSLVKPLNDTIYSAPTLQSGITGNEPDINVDPPTLYYYLSKKINLQDVSTAVSEKDKQEKKNTEDQGKADTEAENSKGKDETYLRGLGSDLTNISGGAGLNALTAITSIADTVRLVLDGNFDEFRDKLYVCEYVMDMFSYSSFNNEGQYNLAKDSDKYLTLTDFNKGDKAFSDYVSTWETEDAQNVYDNQSLTNKHRSSSINTAMLGEAEYVIYGKSTIEDNLKSSYSSIFAIRESLNLISGFQNFYAGTDSTMARAISIIASGVCSATCGIVPIPLTKAILIGVLATMETAHDMKRLKAGTPVALYKKSKDEWSYANISYDSLFSGDLELEDSEDVNGLFYSDYIYILLIMAANNDGVYSAMLLRIGDLIEANMGNIENDFDLSKSYCYFRLNSTLKVKPLLLTLPLVNTMEGVDGTVTTEKTNWCTYKVDITRGYS